MINELSAKIAAEKGIYLPSWQAASSFSIEQQLEFIDHLTQIASTITLDNMKKHIADTDVKCQLSSSTPKKLQTIIGTAKTLPRTISALLSVYISNISADNIKELMRAITPHEDRGYNVDLKALNKIMSDNGGTGMMLAKQLNAMHILLSMVAVATANHLVKNQPENKSKVEAMLQQNSTEQVNFSELFCAVNTLEPKPEKTLRLSLFSNPKKGAAGSEETVKPDAAAKK